MNPTLQHQSLARKSKRDIHVKKLKKMTCTITNDIVFLLFLVIQSISRDRNVNFLLCFYFLHLAG